MLNKITLYDILRNKTNGEKMAGGRPRTTCPEHDELIELGEEMIKWFESHPEALHLTAWFLIEKRITYQCWEKMIEKPEFRGYYELAKGIVGQNYLDKNSNVREGVSQRWQRVYFKDLRNQEDEDLKNKALVLSKAANEAGCTPEQIAALQKAININAKNESTKS